MAAKNDAPKVSWYASMARRLVANCQKSCQCKPQARTTNPAKGMSTITVRKNAVTPMVRPKPGSALNFRVAIQISGRVSLFSDCRKITNAHPRGNSLSCWIKVVSDCPFGFDQRRRRYRSASSARSEEHTSELQSPVHLVCRLLLEKKKKKSVSTRWTRS